MVLRFEYFLETLDQPVGLEHSVWLRPLPVSRQAFNGSPPSLPHLGASISVGDYFEGVRAFIEGPGRGAFVRSLDRRGADAAAARAFSIFLVKHGEYYHPARVESEIAGVLYRWVVNVAVSAAGAALLFKEYDLLAKLGREFPVSYIPEVYGAGEVDVGGGRALPMFLGNWLVDFHEFHLTRDDLDGRQALVLWDPENGRIRLDSGQTGGVYHQVARILTHYLNLTDFAGIGAWHHAAGDFVVRLRGGLPEVRLITVREYLPLFRGRSTSGDPAQSIQSFLEALLIFLLDLSIRTRLDRLDGTGALAWSDPLAVQATVAGMLDGLAGKTAPFDLPLPMEPLFRSYLALRTEEDILPLCTAIAQKKYPVGSPELALMGTRLEEHAAALAAAFGQL